MKKPKMTRKRRSRFTPEYCALVRKTAAAIKAGSSMSSDRSIERALGLGNVLKDGSTFSAYRSGKRRPTHKNLLNLAQAAHRKKDHLGRPWVASGLLVEIKLWRVHEQAKDEERKEQARLVREEVAGFKRQLTSLSRLRTELAAALTRMSAYGRTRDRFYIGVPPHLQKQKATVEKHLGALVKQMSTAMKW